MKKGKKRGMTHAALAALLLALVCAGAFPVHASAASAKAKVGGKKKVTITEGRLIQLFVKNAGKKKITWKSSDRKTATVTKGGLVNALKPGTVKITAKLASGSAVFKLKILKNRFQTTKTVAAEYAARQAVFFLPVSMYYKKGRLYVKGCWINSTDADRESFGCTLDVLDHRTGKLLASRRITYADYLAAHTCNEPVTYRYAGSEVIRKNYDLRTMDAVCQAAFEG